MQVDGLVRLAAGAMKSRPCLLVMDDEVLISDLLREALVDDYMVISAVTAEEALIRFANERVDVILLDYILPDGCSRKVAERAARAEVPVVWMTGDAEAVEDEVLDGCLILQKPFRIPRLLEALTSARNLMNSQN